MTPIDIGAIINSLIGQAPVAGLAIVALWRVYTDWSIDRDAAKKERDSMLVELTLQTVYIQTIAEHLNVPLPTKQQALELRRDGN